MRNYIDEYFDNANACERIKTLVLEKHKEGLSIMEIVKCLQQEFYIFTDKEETEWEANVVTAIIENKPVFCRWTGEEL